MSAFELTPEMMKNAQTYMPVEIKMELAKLLAESCVVDLPDTEENLPAGEILNLPHLKGEDMQIKQINLMTTLVSYYLQLDYDKEMPKAEVYDYFSSAHLLNQIERYKSDKDLKDIAFDLLADYKEYKKFVDTEIYNLKQTANDPFTRFLSTMAIVNAPESLRKLVEEYQKNGKQIKEILERRKAEGEKQKAEILKGIDEVKK